MLEKHSGPLEERQMLHRVWGWSHLCHTHLFRFVRHWPEITSSSLSSSKPLFPVTEAEAKNQEAIPWDNRGPLLQKITPCSTGIDKKIMFALVFI